MTLRISIDVVIADLFFQNLTQIDHFRITPGLSLEAILGAHLFIRKINFYSHENEFNLRVT